MTLHTVYISLPDDYTFDVKELENALVQALHAECVPARWVSYIDEDHDDEEEVQA